MRRWKLVRQKDSRQCGVACLTMICQNLGLNLSVEEIEEMCPPTKEGVSLLGISETASQLGLECLTVKLTVDKLLSAPMPCILFWTSNHFVVLYKISNNKFYIADPGKGEYRCNETELRRNWLLKTNGETEKGIATFFSPTDLFYKKQDEKIEKYNYVYRVLLHYIKKYHKFFIHIFLCLLLSCILQLVFPFLTQAIVDKGIKHNDLGFIWLILIGELMIAFGQTATDFIRRWFMLHISMRVNIELISDFFIKLLKLPMSFFEAKLIGDIMQRISDHSRVQSFLTGQLISVIFPSLTFVIFGIVLLIYNHIIFYIFLLGSAIYALWVSAFLKKRKVLDYNIFEVQARNQSKTYQFVSCMQEIKLQDCEKRRRWEWEDTQADLFKLQMDVTKMQQSQEAGSVFINELKNILITVFAATAVINGQMTLGAMLAVQYVIGQLNSPIEQFMSFIYSVQDVKISLDRINEIHKRHDENSDSRTLKHLSFGNKIELSNIQFKYDLHATKNTLDGISFNVPDGKVTAIVGASGSGKTTLIKLMLGYYRVLSGNIRISNENINEIDLKWWRRKCGVVMQDGVIFSESIARNIAVDDNIINMERVIEASKIANIHNYVESLPSKYETIVGNEGMGLSQGQKQRILIARAVYKDPDFIFFDEATNALDATNEREIVENLSEFYNGRTVIIVAHRLSTVRNADQIIVLEDGRVAEIGNHNSLTKKKGAYYNLIKNQLELGA